MDKSSSFVKGSCCGVAEKYSKWESYIGGVCGRQREIQGKNRVGEAVAAAS